MGRDGHLFLHQEWLDWLGPLRVQFLKNVIEF
jgi:hypothetical protein